MEKKQLAEEMRFFILRALILDVAAYLISVVFLGATISFGASLLLGTFGISVNMLLLNLTVKKVVSLGRKNAEKRMFSGYLIRLLCLSAVIILASVVRFFNIIGVIVPYIYPVLIYTGYAIFRKGEKNN